MVYFNGDQLIGFSQFLQDGSRTYYLVGYDALSGELIYRSTVGGNTLEKRVKARMAHKYKYLL